MYWQGEGIIRKRELFFQRSHSSELAILVKVISRTFPRSLYIGMTLTSLVGVVLVPVP